MLEADMTKSFAKGAKWKKLLERFGCGQCEACPHCGGSLPKTTGSSSQLSEMVAELVYKSHESDAARSLVMSPLEEGSRTESDDQASSDSNCAVGSSGSNHSDDGRSHGSRCKSRKESDHSQSNHEASSLKIGHSGISCSGIDEKQSDEGTFDVVVAGGCPLVASSADDVSGSISTPQQVRESDHDVSSEDVECAVSATDACERLETLSGDNPSMRSDLGGSNKRQHRKQRHTVGDEDVASDDELSDGSKASKVSTDDGMPRWGHGVRVGKRGTRKKQTGTREHAQSSDEEDIDPSERVERRSLSAGRAAVGMGGVSGPTSAEIQDALLHDGQPQAATRSTCSAGTQTDGCDSRESEPSKGDAVNGLMATCAHGGESEASHADESEDSKTSQQTRTQRIVLAEDMEASKPVARARVVETKGAQAEPIICSMCESQLSSSDCARSVLNKALHCLHHSDTLEPVHLSRDGTSLGLPVHSDKFETAHVSPDGASSGASVPLATSQQKQQEQMQRQDASNRRSSGLVGVAISGRLIRGKLGRHQQAPVSPGELGSPDVVGLRADVAVETKDEGTQTIPKLRPGTKMIATQTEIESVERHEHTRIVAARFHSRSRVAARFDARFRESAAKLMKMGVARRMKIAKRPEIPEEVEMSIERLQEAARSGCSPVGARHPPEGRDGPEPTDGKRASAETMLALKAGGGLPGSRRPHLAQAGPGRKTMTMKAFLQDGSLQDDGEQAGVSWQMAHTSSSDRHNTFTKIEDTKTYSGVASTRQHNVCSFTVKAGQTNAYVRFGLTRDPSDGDGFKQGCYVGLFPKQRLYVAGGKNGKSTETSYTQDDEITVAIEERQLVVYKNDERIHCWEGLPLEGCGMHAKLAILDRGASINVVQMRLDGVEEPWTGDEPQQEAPRSPAAKWTQQTAQQRTRSFSRDCDSAVVPRVNVVSPEDSGSPPVKRSLITANSEASCHKLEHSSRQHGEAATGSTDAGSIFLDSDVEELEIVDCSTNSDLVWNDVPEDVISWLKLNLMQREQAEFYCTHWEISELNHFQGLQAQRREQILNDFDEFLSEVMCRPHAQKHDVRKHIRQRYRAANQKQERSGGPVGEAKVLHDSRQVPVVECPIMLQSPPDTDESRNILRPRSASPPAKGEVARGLAGLAPPVLSCTALSQPLSADEVRLLERPRSAPGRQLGVCDRSLRAPHLLTEPLSDPYLLAEAAKAGLRLPEGPPATPATPATRGLHVTPGASSARPGGRREAGGRALAHVLAEVFQRRLWAHLGDLRGTSAVPGSPPSRPGRPRTKAVGGSSPKLPRKRIGSAHDRPSNVPSRPLPGADRLQATLPSDRYVGCVSWNYLPEPSREQPAAEPEPEAAPAKSPWTQKYAETIIRSYLRPATEQDAAESLADMKTAARRELLGYPVPAKAKAVGDTAPPGWSSTKVATAEGPVSLPRIVTPRKAEPARSTGRGGTGSARQRDVS